MIDHVTIIEMTSHMQLADLIKNISWDIFRKVLYYPNATPCFKYSLPNMTLKYKLRVKIYFEVLVLGQSGHIFIS